MTDETSSAAGTFWEPDIETLSRDKMHELQSEGLQRQLRHVVANSRFYDEWLSAANFDISTVGSVDDLTTVPPFRKQNLRDYRGRTGDPFAGTLCVPIEQLRCATHSSGTSGVPNYFGFTAEELQRVGNIHARASYTVGLRPGDQVMFAGPAWHASWLAWHEGLSIMKAISIYVGANASDVVESALKTGRDFSDINAIWVLRPEEDLATLSAAGATLKDLFPQLRLAWSAIDCSAPRRKLLSDAFGVPFRNHYGSGDQYWMFGECPDIAGTFHVAEDAYIAEVLDFDTSEPVPAGTSGLLHLTNLVGTATPFIRYNMEDAAMMEAGDCACGRTSRRLRPLGRMAWVVETTAGKLFHLQVEEIVWGDARTAGRYYQILREETRPQATLTVRIARAEGDDSADIEATLSSALTSSLGLPVSVELVPMEEIYFASYGKFPRVVDVKN